MVGILEEILEERAVGILEASPEAREVGNLEEILEEKVGVLESRFLEGKAVCKARVLRENGANILKRVG